MLNCPMLLAIIGVALLAVCWLLTVYRSFAFIPLGSGATRSTPRRSRSPCLCCWAALGSGFGVSNLFWHEDWWVQACAGASVAVLASFLWWLSLVASATPRQLPRTRNGHFVSDGGYRGLYADTPRSRSPKRLPFLCGGTHGACSGPWERCLSLWQPPRP